MLLTTGRHLSLLGAMVLMGAVVVEGAMVLMGAVVVEGDTVLAEGVQCCSCYAIGYSMMEGMV